MDKYRKSLLAQGVIPKDVTPKTNVKDVPIAKIVPNRNQPRQNFDPDKLAELSQSIEAVGVIEPIIVRPFGDDYEIVAGERRFQAVKNLGHDKIPCIIRTLNDTEAYELSLVENIQRDDLDPIEEATAYKRLMDEHGYTYREFKRAIGKSEGYINERIQLLSLPEAVKRDVFALRTRTRHARHILKIKENQGLQERVFQKTVDENLTHEDTAELVNLLEDDTVAQDIKDFVLESKEVKPIAAKTVIESGLTEKAAIKVMKKLARRAAGKSSPVEPEEIDALIQREKDKLLAPAEARTENQTAAYFDELRTLAEQLLAKLEPESPAAAQKVLTKKITDLRKTLTEFLSLINLPEVVDETIHNDPELVPGRLAKPDEDPDV